MSHQARKRLKSLFHLGAMSVIQEKGEFQEYYQRKVSEAVPRRDKNKTLVLNAVRNNGTAHAAHPSRVRSGSPGRKI